LKIALLAFWLVASDFREVLANGKIRRSQTSRKWPGSILRRVVAQDVRSPGSQNHCERGGEFFCILRKVPIPFMMFA
jgi:hypothetical protein